MPKNKLDILVIGASGATGRLLVEQLLNRGQKVKAVVRTPDSLPESIRNHENVTIIHASILDLTDAEMVQHVSGCSAVISCLGHNLSFKGIYGKPRRLVTDATRRLCNAIKANRPQVPIKFVLMNTTGNRNRDLDESISFAEKCVLALLRLLVPPHPDNEGAAEYLRIQIGQSDEAIEWVAVRPDTLIKEELITEYESYPSPIRSAIFDSGRTSRINVAHFMAELAIEDTHWQKWKGQMPVIYNRTSS